MGKRRKRKKHSSQSSAPSGATKVFLEYYQPAFALFHQDLEKMGYDAFKPHEIARSFWNVVPPGGYRNDKIDATLREVDSKAKWLARNPKGTNYDISRFGSTLPVAVTPFAEYIPSEARFYWLEEGVPRVLTPEELRDLLGGGRLLEIAAASPNTVYIGGPKA